MIKATINNKNNTPVFVYGTLMKGKSASHYMEDADFLGTAELPGYAMYDLGWYPGILEQKGSSVHGEVYLVCEEMLKDMDGYEGEGFLYMRKTVAITGMDGVPEAQAYVYLRPVGEAQRIHSGRWDR